MEFEKKVIVCVGNFKRAGLSSFTRSYMRSVVSQSYAISELNGELVLKPSEYRITKALEQLVTAGLLVKVRDESDQRLVRYLPV